MTVHSQEIFFLLVFMIYRWNLIEILIFGMALFCIITVSSFYNLFSVNFSKLFFVKILFKNWSWDCSLCLTHRQKSGFLVWIGPWNCDPRLSCFRVALEWILLYFKFLEELWKNLPHLESFGVEIKCPFKKWLHPFSYEKK